jgi:phage terminase Nu1 subunit (DNA packaging protein)
MQTELRQLLASVGAVVIEGRKACGQTMIDTDQADHWYNSGAAAERSGVVRQGVRIPRDPRPARA